MKRGFIGLSIVFLFLVIVIIYFKNYNLELGPPGRCVGRSWDSSVATGCRVLKDTDQRTKNWFLDNSAGASTEEKQLIAKIIGQLNFEISKLDDCQKERVDLYSICVSSSYESCIGFTYGTMCKWDSSPY